MTFENELKAYNEKFEGWDFSYINKRGIMQESPLKWNYETFIRKYIEDANAMLDMGTGGGEFLSSLENLPEIVEATESYPPNILIAKERLEPMGINVYAVNSDEKFPIESERYDLIINRHESYDPGEIYRILKPGGYFITQQVGGKNDWELNEKLGAPEMEYIDWDLESALSKLGNFTIEKALEDFTITRTYELSALVYYLKAIPWQIPDFDLEKYEHGLRKIYDEIECRGHLDMTLHRFLIVAKKA
jgi:SAM-dependent methyltransferase